MNGGWLVLFFLTVIPIGKGISQQRLIDSLLRIESSISELRDSNKAVLYLELARAHQQGKAAQGLGYAEKALRLSREYQLPTVQAAAFSVLGTLHLVLRQYSEAHTYFTSAFTSCQALGDTKGMANALNNTGLVQYSLSDYGRALEYFLQSIRYNERVNNAYGLALNHGNIGNIYNALQEYEKAIESYEKAQTYARSAGNDQYRDALLNNIGNSFTQLGQYDKALEYKLEALALARKSGNKSRIATSLGNVGNVYNRLNRYADALAYHRQALQENALLADKRLEMASWFGLAEAFMGMANVDSSFVYFQKANMLAVKLKDVSMQAGCMEKMSQLYRNIARMDSAYTTYKRFVELQATLENSRKLKEITQLQLKYQFAKKEDSLLTVQLRIDNALKEKSLLAAQQQQELERKQAQYLLAEKQRQINHLAWLESQANLRTEQANVRIREKQVGLLAKEKEVQQAKIKLQDADIAVKQAAIERGRILAFFYISGIFLLLLLAFFIFRNYRNQKKSNVIIEREKQKSDGLLRNILPAEVAEELKETGTAQARYFSDVSVIFTDFVGFTRVAENMTPQELVSMLNRCFTAFDDIVRRHGIEKIKTIGDAYMAVAGLPTERTDHADAAVSVALEFLSFVQAETSRAGLPFQIRIGIHSGPVVAGIVGHQKFAYDIWGDTVNIASRMESSGIAGGVNLSGASFEKLTTQLPYTYRGKIQAKNKGELDMYLLGPTEILSRHNTGAL